MRGLKRNAQRLGKLLCRAARSEAAATGIEYSIIAGLLALTIVVGAMIAGNGMNHMFQIIGSAMEGATNAATR